MGGVCVMAAAAAGYVHIAIAAPSLLVEGLQQQRPLVAGYAQCDQYSHHSGAGRVSKLRRNTRANTANPALASPPWFAGHVTSTSTYLQVRA